MEHLSARPDTTAPVTGATSRSKVTTAASIASPTESLTCIEFQELPLSTLQIRLVGKGNQMHRHVLEGSTML